MVVCYNKVMGVAVVLQIEQKMESEETGAILSREREQRERNAVTIMLRMNIHNATPTV